MLLVRIYFPVYIFQLAAKFLGKLRLQSSPSTVYGKALCIRKCIRMIVKLSFHTLPIWRHLGDRKILSRHHNPGDIRRGLAVKKYPRIGRSQRRGRRARFIARIRRMNMFRWRQINSRRVNAIHPLHFLRSRFYADTNPFEVIWPWQCGQSTQKEI